MNVGVAEQASYIIQTAVASFVEPGESLGQRSETRSFPLPAEAWFLLLIIADNLNLYLHSRTPQAGNSNAGPRRMVLRTPLLEIPHHRIHCNRVYPRARLILVNVIRVDSEHGSPTFSGARIFETEIDVRERLIDLLADVRGHLHVVWVPAACAKY